MRIDIKPPGEMEIGDGLTLHSRTINGKSMPGIYLIPNSEHKLGSQKGKFKPKSQNFVANNRKQINNNFNNKKNANYSRKRIQPEIVGEEKKNDQNRPTNNKSKEKVDKKKEDSIVFINDNVQVESDNKLNQNKNPEISEIKSRSKQNKNIRKVSANLNNSNSKRKSSKQSDVTAHVDTKYVTLTQGQLTTILSLVKTKQDIDLAEVITKDKKSKNLKKSESSLRSSTEPAQNVEPTSVPGLDLSDDEKGSDVSSVDNNNEETIKKLLKRDGKKKKDNDKDNEEEDKEKDDKKKKTDGSKKNDDLATSPVTKKENLSGTLGGFGTRDREKSRIEQRRKQWILDLNEQVENNKKLENEKKQLNKQIKSASIGPDSTQNKSDIKLNPNNSAPSSAKLAHRPNDSQKEEQSKSSLNVENIHGNLPAAIRSSFFLGEAAPRDHAFSAKKRQEQKRWREELEKQMQEQKRDQNKSKLENKQPQDDAVWARHFETMQPPVQLKRSLSPSNFHVTSSAHQDSPRNYLNNNSINKSLDNSSPSKHANNGWGLVGDSQDNIGRSDVGPTQGNYLRTMTSLLDPAQIEAIELRRMKQDEHRRAIEEQVQEKKRAKEEVEKARKREEEQEEKKLKEERDNLQKQFDYEKNKQTAMEEIRERQTRELYNQMKEAKASAMKDKFEKRQQHLRDKGHDTSRLEQTHKHTLEINTSMQVQKKSPERNHFVPPIDFSELHSTSKHQYQTEPQIKYSPVSVLANSSQGPIKLEISLNQSQLKNALVETAVQTEQNEEGGMFSNILLDSSDDTEYLPLPYPSGRRAQNKKKKFRKNEERKQKTQYDRYSRVSPSDRNETTGVEARREKTKPKWGAGKKKKSYVPASERYVNGAQWKEKHELNRQRREEKLLNQQALNDPERLLTIRRRNERDVDRGRSPSPPIPTLQNKLYDQNNIRQNRNNPQKNQRSRSPPVPAVRHRLIGSSESNKNNKHGNHDVKERSNTSMSVTTDQAKFKSHKHSSTSPVPDTIEYVEYTRSEDVLNPNQPSSRSHSDVRTNNNNQWNSHSNQYKQQPSNQDQVKKPNNDPLLNADVVKQHERQDRILRQISILRQGLLLKQREVASYPTNFNNSTSGRNLPERTNDNVMR